MAVLLSTFVHLPIRYRMVKQAEGSFERSKSSAGFWAYSRVSEQTRVRKVGWCHIPPLLPSLDLLQVGGLSIGNTQACKFPLFHGSALGGVSRQTDRNGTVLGLTTVPVAIGTSTNASIGKLNT